MVCLLKIVVLTLHNEMISVDSFNPNILKFGLPIGLGLASQAYLRPVLKQIVHFVNNTLPPDSLSNHLTKSEGINKFLSVVIPFFRVSLDDKGVKVLWYNLGSLGFTWSLWAGLEGIRHGGTALHFAYPVVCLFNQLLGMTIVTPMVWIPTFLAFQKKAAPVSAGSVLLLFAGQLLAALPAYEMFTQPEPARTKAITWFQISPMLGWLTWAAAPIVGANLDTLIKKIMPFIANADPRVAAQSAFLVSAGFGLAMHMQTLSALAEKGLWKRVLSFFKFKSGSHAVGHFIASDLVGLFSGLLWIVYLEGGFVDVLKVAALIPIVGPGAALSFHLASRESLLA